MDDINSLEPITNAKLAMGTLHDETMTRSRKHREIVKSVTGVSTQDPSIFLMELAREARNQDQELAFKCASEVLKNQTKVQELIAKQEDKGEDPLVNINVTNGSNNTGPSFDLDDVSYE